MGGFEPVRIMLRGGEEVLLREAVEEDAGAILAFIVEAAGTTDQILTCPDEFPSSVDEEAEFIRARARAPRSVLISAWDGPTAIGTLGMRGHPLRRQAHTAELGMMVAAPWRGKGLGRALMNAGIGWARGQDGLSKICLCCFHTNSTGLALYESVGFVREGCRVAQARLERAGGRFEDVDEVMMGLRLD